MIDRFENLDDLLSSYFNHIRFPACVSNEPETGFELLPVQQGMSVTRFPYLPPSTGTGFTLRFGSSEVLVFRVHNSSSLLVYLNGTCHSAAWLWYQNGEWKGRKTTESLVDAMNSILRSIPSLADYLNSLHIGL